jgi:hypothetical protein
MGDIREKIIATYAEWTALSALRSGAPIKSRYDVYSALRACSFDVLFDKNLGSISRSEFNRWHRSTTTEVVQREPRLSVGWATKIVNVYLKTRAYIGAQGRHHLSEALHPPIDAGLWLGLRRRFADRPDILEHTHCVETIRAIVDYECYERIIRGCCLAAAELGCKLIEVEQLWAGTEIPARPNLRIRPTGRSEPELRPGANLHDAKPRKR